MGLRSLRASWLIPYSASRIRFIRGEVGLASGGGGRFAAAMIELRCPLDAEMADPLEEHFLEQVRSSWMLIQAKPTDTYHLHGYFATREEGEAAWVELRAAFPGLPVVPEWRDVADRDWKEAYKLHFKPWARDGLHWVPSWERAGYTVPPGEVSVVLDPGMAFGTGSHETTRLCAVRLLEARARWQGAVAGRAVIDAGCGTGLLALSAVKLGFGNVTGFDHDPEAVSVSLANRAENGLPEDRPVFLEAGLEDGLRGRTADVVLANIQADVLMIYRTELLAAVRPGGVLALSGILATESDQVRASFVEAAPAAWGASPALVDVRVDGEWSDLALVRG